MVDRLLGQLDRLFGRRTEAVALGEPVGNSFHDRLRRVAEHGLGVVVEEIETLFVVLRDESTAGSG